jgi:hypothetical protein
MYEAALRIPPQQVGVSAAGWGLPSDSHRSRMTLPPLDLNVAGLGNRRLRRRAMCIEHPYETRLAAYLKTHSSLDARELGRHLPAL